MNEEPNPTIAPLCMIEGVLLRISNELKDGGAAYPMLAAMALRGCAAWVREVREAIPPRTEQP